MSKIKWDRSERSHKGLADFDIFIFNFVLKMVNVRKDARWRVQTQLSQNFQLFIYKYQFILKITIKSI